jgi:hypothetical protein
MFSYSVVIKDSDFAGPICDNMAHTQRYRAGVSGCVHCVSRALLHAIKKFRWVIHLNFTVSRLYFIHASFSRCSFTRFKITISSFIIVFCSLTFSISLNILTCYKNQNFLIPHT